MKTKVDKSKAKAAEVKDKRWINVKVKEVKGQFLNAKRLKLKKGQNKMKKQKFWLVICMEGKMKGK